MGFLETHTKARVWGVLTERDLLPSLPIWRQEGTKTGRWREQSALKLTAHLPTTSPTQKRGQMFVFMFSPSPRPVSFYHYFPAEL